MQIKNKILIVILFVLSSITLNLKLYADEFNISATEIIVDKTNNTIIGKGSVEAIDSEGKIIKADKVTYEKSIEFLLAEGDVEILDNEGNTLKTDKASYDKLKEIILTYNNSELIMKEGYQLTSSKILYDNSKKIISSDQNSILTDIDGNVVETATFEYNLNRKLFSSIGNIKITDIKKNKYFFKELHVDTQKKEMIGSDVSVILDQANFGVSKENDPRLVANNIFMSKEKSDLSKAVFTVCKKRDGDKCPPWSIKAKKIGHDKIKKTVYYDNAVLKFYGIPIFYFPKFFHPDPTVKRQSGFLMPFFTNATNLGTGFGLPYYWAISHDKDITFTPKTYTKENMLFLNEYRQAFKNGFLTLDTSYNQGYKETSSKKTAGSRNHIFADLYLDFGMNKPYESDLSVKIQRTSNDTYFKVHDINTALVDSENTNLENKILYNFNKENASLSLTAAVYEDISKDGNARYEYILPNLLFGKSIFTEKFGTINFKSGTKYRNYEVDKHVTSFTNDFIWNPASFITKKGFVNNLEGIVKNTNYEARNTTDYKTDGVVNEISSVLSFKSSLPMKKEGNKFSKIFSPNFMIRYAPGHMKDLRGDDVTLKYANLFATNKTSVIEDGLSAVLGFQYKINEKENNDKEKLSISLGQVFSPEKNKDIPSKSSLDQKMSDVVGEIDYNFSKIGNISYKFSLDHNFNDLNYNEVSTSLNFGKVDFNVDYLEERNHVGTEHYVNSGITLNINDNNKLSFETKKNFKTDSTELYDMSYQYINDCLTAGLVYRREFYEDNDLEPKDTLMFTITFVPLAGVKTPLINP